MNLLISLCLITSLPNPTLSSPDNFGALGDGVTDDTAAVVEAMSKGGTVMLTAGKTYLVTAPLKVPSDIILKSPDGEAPATIKVGPASAGTTGVLLAKASGVTFKNVNFESVKGDFNSLIGITDGDHITITGCKFSKNPKKSSVLLRMKDSRFMDVNNSEFTEGYVAIHSLGKSSDIKIAENKVHDIDQYGIWVQGSVNTFSERVQILKNDVFNVHRGEGQTAGHMIYVQIGEGISSKRHKYVDVIGNKLVGLDKAFTVGGNGDLIEYCDVDGGSVSENIADKGGDVGIAVIRSSGILLEKNKAGFNNTNGIVLWEASNCKLLNNEAYNNNQDRLKQWGTRASKGGIRIMARTGTSDNNEITGNKCWDDQAVKTQDYGIYLMKSAKNTKVGKNQLTGNKYGAIKDESVGMFGG